MTLYEKILDVVIIFGLVLTLIAIPLAFLLGFMPLLFDFG
jgi:hypothetical protein